MKNLEIFKFNIKFDWVEIYVGLMNSWISVSDVLDFVQNDKIQQASDAEYIELYWALDESLYEFMKCIVEFTGKDLPIEIEGIGIEDLPQNISNKIWKKWELEFLLQLKKTTKPLSDKIYDIYLLWSDLMHIFYIDWKNFLWLYNMETQNEELLYDNFITYTEKLKSELLEKK